MVTLKLREEQQTQHIALLSEQDRLDLVNCVYEAMQLADQAGKKEKANRLENLFTQFQSLGH